MKFPIRPLAAWLAAAGIGTAVLAKDYRVTVAPAAVDRVAQIVSFELPTDAPKPAVLTQAGATLPLQVAADGTATFIVPAQRAGELVVCMLTDAPSAPAAAKGVEAKKADGRLHVTIGGRPALDYQMDKEALPRADIKPEYKRAGYLHPIYTESGTIISDDYPAQHIHHHGIWSPWTKTTFQGRTPDFWNMGGKTGTVEFVALDWTWSGPVHGGFVARHRFVDLSAPNPVTALHEVWEVTAYNVSDLRLFHLTITQVCATNDPLGLPQYHYGGLGFRGRGEWLGRDKAKFLASEGETDRVKMNATKMRWIHMEGAVDGGTAGLAVLGHPENFRAPQPVRVHPNEPYFSVTPQQAGGFRIEPGKPYVARFRVVAADGPPNRAKLDALWNGYATTASVKVEAVR